MRVPKRQSELHKKYGRTSDDRYLTQSAMQRLKRDLEDLQDRQRPQAVEDLTRAREMGDLSENAAYSEAKGRLARIDGRIFSLKERLKYAIPIESGADASGRIRIGATVTVEVGGKERQYEILGSQETNPAKGRISHLSPLGKALMGRKAGEAVTITNAEGREIDYRIVDVR